MKKNDKKIILYLRTDWDAHHMNIGGSVTHTIGVIKGFQSLGYQVKIASCAMVDICKTLVHNELFVLQYSRFLRLFGCKINCLIANVLFTIHLLWYTRSIPISYIYQRYTLLSMVGVLLAKIKRVPLIIEYNGSEVWIDTFWAPKRRLALRHITRFIERTVVRAADYIVVVSQPLQQELMQYGVAKDRIILNPNGVDTHMFDAAQLTTVRTEMRNGFSLTKHHIVFGFIGTFSYWHGIELLIRVIPTIVTQYPQVFFMLIGDGPMRALIQEQLCMRADIASHLIMPGAVAWQKAPAYLSMCDVFLMPTQPNPDGTEFFGSPTKLFEYMSMAKPIITSSIGQIPSILGSVYTLANLQQTTTTECGIIVDPCNDDQYIKAIIWMIQSSDAVRVQMGLNARKRVEQSYTWVSHTQTILDYVQQG